MRATIFNIQSGGREKLFENRISHAGFCIARWRQRRRRRLHNDDENAPALKNCRSLCCAAAASSPLPSTPPRLVDMLAAAVGSSAEVAAPPACLHPLHLLDTFLVSRNSAENAPQTDTTNPSPLPERKPNEEISRQDEILRVADYLYGGSILEAALAVLDSPGAIRHVKAASSNRFLYLVRGASRGHSSCEYYLCLMQHGVLYCSCRSYFERAKTDVKALCKHLLALKLLPHLECRCCQEEIVPDSEYASFLMKKISHA